ncbi:MAG: IS66 family insertion sequence element accessory protein TnpA [Arenicella sp.]
MRQTQWQKHIDAWQTSPLTKRAYARKHKLSYAQFLYWNKKLTLAQPALPNDFVAVTIKPESDVPTCLGFVEFPNGSRLVIHSPELLTGLPILFE